jgi:proline dehydrogenase
MAMRMMGEQFVTGETIAEALKRARPLEAKGFRYSYDMLGEAATTAADAERYLSRLRKRHPGDRQGVGTAAASIEGPGISIKLSALHPRYSPRAGERVMASCCPREGAGGDGQAATTSASTSTPKRPTAWSCRSTCSKASPSIPIWPAGTASASSCRPMASAARS